MPARRPACSTTPRYFPSPSYYALKAAAIGAIGAAKTALAFGDRYPNVLRAPTRPYRIGVPYWTEGDGLLELPIQVTRGLRLPFIGTAVTTAGPTGAKLLTRMVVGEPLVNLELHGIDVLDPRTASLGSTGTSTTFAFRPRESSPRSRR